MNDRIHLSKGQIIKIGGLPFELEADTVVLGCENNLKLLDKDGGHYKFLGVTNVRSDAQSETSAAIIASSESMNGVR